MILASGSPQRRAILEQLGVAFTVIVSNVDELTAGEPEHVALENARRKASAVAGELGAGLDAGTRSTGDALASAGAAPSSFGAAPPIAQTILGVDTLVELDGRIFGKPRDRAHAAETLSALSGRSHRVLSGVSVRQGGSERSGVAVTTVEFRPIGDSALDWYLDTGEWEGRAGGYAIQGRGAALVKSIDGDYLNVVGLPVALLISLLPSLLFPAVF